MKTIVFNILSVVTLMALAFESFGQQSESYSSYTIEGDEVTNLCENGITGNIQRSPTTYTFWSTGVVFNNDYQLNVLAQIDPSLNECENFNFSLAIYGPMSDCEVPYTVQNGTSLLEISEAELSPFLLATLPMPNNALTPLYNYDYQIVYEIPGQQFSQPFENGRYFFKLVVNHTCFTVGKLNLSFDLSADNFSCSTESIFTPNLYEICDNHYSACISEGIASFPISQDGGEVWVSTIVNANATDTWKFNYPEPEAENCERTEFGYEIYGPFTECLNACALISEVPFAQAPLGPVTMMNGVANIYSASLNNTLNEPVMYLAKIIVGPANCGDCPLEVSFGNTVNTSACYWPDEDPAAEVEAECENCLPPMALIPGEPYVVSAWVKQEDAELYQDVYTRPKIIIKSLDGTTEIATIEAESGDSIIEGWQLIEAEFEAPANGVQIVLFSFAGTSYFDDVRLFPAKGSMKTYVYDPVTLRFVAELDERHFATLYEYDEEGRLMRIKKETERGIMTIQESKTSTVKTDNN
ncbi:MAG: hypothetical protein ACKVOK_12590 [Flavobacteriales bacterium]